MSAKTSFVPCWKLPGIIIFRRRINFADAEGGHLGRRSRFGQDAVHSSLGKSSDGRAFLGAVAFYFLPALSKVLPGQRVYFRRICVLLFYSFVLLW
jgi:hypothetical protein